MGKLSPEQVINRYGALDSDRGVWKTHWQEIMDFYIPERADILIDREPGTKRRNHLFDSSGEHSMDLLNAALFSMLTPRHSKWIAFTTGDELLDAKDNIRAYLQRVDRQFLDVLNNSNFYRAIQEHFQDLTSVGTSPMAVEEDDETNVRFTVHHIAKTVVDENNKGDVDEIYRKFSWNAKKIIAEFGEDNIPQKVIRAFETGSMDKFDIIHAVYPQSIGRKETKVRMPFISQFVLVEGQTELGPEEGFRLFPFVVPRWMKMTGEIYGRSPCMSALPEVKVINQMEKTVLKGAQKTIDPPPRY